MPASFDQDTYDQLLSKVPAAKRQIAAIKGILRKAGEALKKAAGRAAEKQLDLAFGAVAGVAATKLLELLPHFVETL